MDPRERRQATTRTARLGFLLIGNLAAVFFLLNQCGGEAPVVPEVSAAQPAEPAVDLAGRPSLADLTRNGRRPAESASPSPAREGTETREPEPARLDPELTRRIEGHIAEAIRLAAKKTKNRANAGNCEVALSVLDGRGAPLVQRGAETVLRPASNMKLVTSAAALLLLGETGSFNTRFEAHGSLADGVLQGDLVVRAGGDPLYDPLADGEVLHLLEPLVQALVQRGLREVRGDLVLDTGSYSDPAPAAGWPSSDQYWQEHCALAAGFTANASCLTAFVVPTQVGAQARAELRPDLGGLARSGTVTTVSSKKRLNIAVGATRTKATLRGSIPQSPRPWTQRFSHPDPVGLFGAVLNKALQRGGISVSGAVRVARNLPGGQELHTLRTPIVSVLEPINADSNNSVADQLFFALGQQVEGAGNRTGGEAAARRALGRLGVSDRGLVMADGSGLSRDNRVAPAQLTQLLYSVARQGGSLWPLYLGSLAVSGEKGSLAKRMKDTPAQGRVYAKTGWINGTSALSGYVKTESGEMLSFSLLINYPNLGGLNTSCWKPMGDRICVELAEWTSEPSRVK